MPRNSTHIVFKRIWQFPVTSRTRVLTIKYSWQRQYCTFKHICSSFTATCVNSMYEVAFDLPRAISWTWNTRALVRYINSPQAKSISEGKNDSEVIKCSALFPNPPIPSRFTMRSTWREGMKRSVSQLLHLNTWISLREVPAFDS